MRLPGSLTGRLHRERPVLRVQLALLYSGVFVGLVVLLFIASSVLFGTANVFFGHSQTAFHPGTLLVLHASKMGENGRFLFPENRSAPFVAPSYPLCAVPSVQSAARAASRRTASCWRAHIVA